MPLSLPLVLRNARLVVPIALLQGGIYFALNHHPLWPSRSLTLTWVDDVMPFWPWTMWPYLLMISGTAVLPLTVRDPVLFRQTLWTYLLAYLLTFTFHLFWPTHCIRPDPPDDGTLQTWAYRCLITLDAPHSCFPSGHIVGPAILCWAFWRDGYHLGRWLLYLFPFFSLTILTTKQHYFWDWLGGYALALVAIYGSVTYHAMRKRGERSPISRRLHQSNISGPRKGLCLRIHDRYIAVLDETREPSASRIPQPLHKGRGDS